VVNGGKGRAGQQEELSLRGHTIVNNIRSGCVKPCVAIQSRRTKTGHEWSQNRPPESCVKHGVSIEIADQKMAYQKIAEPNGQKQDTIGQIIRRQTGMSKIAYQSRAIEQKQVTISHRIGRHRLVQTLRINQEP
jgi:hypothetical protein